MKLKDFKTGKLQISDNIVLSEGSTREITKEGYLKAIAAVTRVGVHIYSAREFDVDSDEDVGVFRPPETVFHPETASSLKLKPIALLHPDQDIDSSNYFRHAVGTVGENVEALDENILGASIQVTDESVVKRILDKDIEELSLGYNVDVISEEGMYEGQKYAYKMDGPMLNNHLAIVPEGRCGDTVKILDKGAKKVNKKQMIKLLGDSGVAEDKIKLFMVDAKDDDAGDFEAYTKLLTDMKVKDIDMAALVPALVVELKPQLEEAIKTPEFLSSLAKEIAASMAGAGATDPADPDIEGDADADDADPEADPKKKKEITPEVVDAKIKDGIKARAIILDRVKPFITDKDYKIHDATDRQLLEKALTSCGIKDEQMKGKSDDYLSGLLDMIAKDRDEATSFIHQDWTKKDGVSLSKPMSALDARTQLKD